MKKNNIRSVHALKFKVTTDSKHKYPVSENVLARNFHAERKGEKWVYFWGNWKGKFTKNGDEIVVPIHHAMLFVDGKIVSELNFFDSLPIYLAQQALEKEEM